MQLRKEAFLMKEKNELLVKRNVALETQVKALTLDYAQLDQIKNDFRERVHSQNEYVSSMEDRVYKSNKISLELLKQLKDAELEIECLKQYTLELRNRLTVYVPVKDDLVDKVLGEFINSSERSNLNLMFVRDAPSVYTFGTRKIHMVLEGNSNKLRVKVAGGYTSLEEFVDLHAQQELVKLER